MQLKQAHFTKVAIYKTRATGFERNPALNLQFHTHYSSSHMQVCHLCYDLFLLDSEDSADDIIVKTISVPEAMVGDSACSDCKVAGESNKDGEDSGEVFPKVIRGRMKFPSTPQCKTLPQQSSTCLNGSNGHDCDGLYQKLKDSKTETCHQGE